MEGKKNKKDKGAAPKKKVKEETGSEDIVHSAAMAHASKILERMANQNTFADVTEDFKFWEDQSDLYRDEGTLLPLWRFSFEKTKKKHVTAVKWNPSLGTSSPLATARLTL